MAQLRDIFGTPLNNQYVIPKNTKLANKFKFSPENNFIEINEPDFKRLVLVVNTTRSLIVYNPVTDLTGGTEYSNGVNLSVNTSQMHKTDKILALYEYNVTDSSKILCEILFELQKQTLYLEGIQS